MKGKRVLVVYAHPEPKSFTGSMRNTVVKALTGKRKIIIIFAEEGAIVVESDLY
jgi:putative NADPH-quinone reductase